MTATPRLELESLRWETAVTAPRTAGKDGPRPGAVVPPVGAEPRYEVIEVSGRVRSVSGSDFRTVSDAVNDFLDKLKKRPGLEVLSAKLPFDIGSETSLSGDIGAERVGEAPPFKVVFGKKLAP